MAEDIKIYKDVEKAIIMCFKNNPNRRFLNGEIRWLIKDYGYVADYTKRIQRMAEKGYLSYDVIEGGNHYYYLNPEYNFILSDPLPKPLISPNGTTTGDRKEHSNMLKEAIQTCIDNLVEPSPHSKRTAAPSVIAACEKHLLFSDLPNHLPESGIDVLEKWCEYKDQLMKLDELKKDLISSLSTRILNCFEGLELKFLYRDEEYSGYIPDYNLTFTPEYLYELVMEPDAEEHYYSCVEFLEDLNSPIIEIDDDFIEWGKGDVYLIVHKKDNELLRASVPRFIDFFEGFINDSKFREKAVKIHEKVDLLLKDRDYILKSLRESLLYTSFRGDCRYLG